MSIKERLKDVVKKKKICFRKSNEKLRKISTVYVIFQAFKTQCIRPSDCPAELIMIRFNRFLLILSDGFIIIKSKGPNHMKKEKTMKKLFAGILILSMMIALAVCGGSASAAAPAATPEPAVEEAAGTVVKEYGIPIYDSAEEVDLAAVFEGHKIRTILDFFDNIEVKQDLLQVQPDMKFDMLISDYYFKDSDQYVYYSEQESKKHDGTTYMLFLYDKEDPNYYYRFTYGGQTDKDKSEVPVEGIDVMLDSPICGFYPDYYDFTITNAKEEDGLYAIEFEVTPKTNLKEDAPALNYDFDNCSVKIDPATSLIRAFGYHQTFDGGETTVSADISYNVDKEPDYSIKY